MASNFDNAKKTSLDVNLFSYKMEDIHADSTSIRGGSDNINFSMPQSFTEFSGSRSVSANVSGGIIGTLSAVAIAPTATLVGATGGFKINLVWDTTVSTAPAAFQAGIIQAAQQLCNVLSNNITINLGITCSGTGGGASAGPTGGFLISYSTVRADLISHATVGDTTFNILPATSTIQGQANVAVWDAECKIWGIATTDALDGHATFATDIAQNALTGVALHELTHALGRIPYGAAPDIFDLFRFTSASNMLFNGASTGVPAAYFSIDGGVTKLADYGQNSDPSDFLNTGVQGSTDSFNEYYSPGSTLQTLSNVDLTQLKVLGFNLQSVTVATFLAANPIVSNAISDTGAAIATNIDNLQLNLVNITSLTQSDAAALAITASQLSSDAGVLGLLKPNTYTLNVSGATTANYATVLANSHVSSVIISDTGAAIVLALDAIQANANAGKITTITLTNATAPTLAISASQLTSDATALAKISSAYSLTVSGVTAANYATVIANSHVSSVVISDTGSAIVSALDAIQTNTNAGKITSIILTDATAPTLAITASQLTSGASALAKISSAYSLTVSGVTTANYTIVIANSHVSSVVIADTGLAIVSALDAIQTNANAGKITTITLTDATAPGLAITASQLTGDASALAKISSAYSLTLSGVTTANYATVIANTHVSSVVITDTGSAIVTALDAIQTNANAAKITSITVSDIATPLAITATQLANDATALAKITGAYSLTVSDTSANIELDLSLLHTNISHISSITVTGATQITVTSAEASAYADVISKLSGVTVVTAGPVTVANFLAANPIVSGAISDTGSAIAANLDNLQQNLVKIASLTQTDIAPLAITASQLSTDAGVLALLSPNTYTLNVSATTTANYVSVLANTHVSSVVIADTAAAIVSALDALKANVNTAKITSININDIATALSITPTQSLADYAVLAKIAGTYNLTVTGTAAADALYDTVNSRATLIGGAAIDTFNVTGTDTITDLGAGGADVLKIAAGATANATINTAWTASATTTTNSGTANITTSGLAVNLAAVTTGSNGYKVTNTGVATTLTGSSLADTLIGGTGNDSLVGGLGANSLTGGAGLDTFTVTGTDTITDLGAGGVDVLKISAGAKATATINTAWTAAVTTTNSGTATITTSGLAVNLAAVTTGTAGYTVTNTGVATTLTGSSLADTLIGGIGNDSLVGGLGVNSLTGGAGIDTFTVTGTDTITDLGAGGADVLKISAGATATATINTAWTAAVTTTNSGTANITTSGLAVNLAAVTTGTAGYKVTNTGVATTLTGSSLADTLTGNSDNDTLSGGAGNDSLVGGLGVNSLTGGLGIDTFTVTGTDTITDLGSGGADVLTIAVGATASATINTAWTATAATTNSGKATISTSALAVNLALVTTGTNGFNVTNTGIATTLTGSGLADTLTGGAVNDTLSGGAGNDSLAGGLGTNSLTGGAGIDTFTVTGIDTIADLGAGGADVLTVAVGATANATINTSWTATALSINSGIANITTAGLVVNLAAVTTGNGYKITNTGVASTLTGTGFADTLIGGTGNDTLVGGLGTNTLTGGTGIDTFTVTSTDTITDLGAGGADVLTVAAGATASATVTAAWTATVITTNSGTANITSSGLVVNLAAVTTGINGFNVTDTGIATTLTGSGLADKLTGGTGNDTLTAGAGNDTLVGGLGKDSLTGGAGTDYFVFNTAPNTTTNLDTITDFVSGTDKLQFSKAIFAGITTAVGTGAGTTLTATEFVTSATAVSGTTATSHLVYNTATGGLYYDADGNGVGAAVEVAIIGTTTHPALVAADILIIA